MILNTTACQLMHRGVAKISGDDRFAFLQGLISNDMALCTPENPLYAALLTPQGKFLREMFLYNQGEFYLLESEASRLDELLQTLTRYKLRAKVTLENVSDLFAVWAFPEGGFGFRDPRLPALGTRAVMQAGKLPAAMDICNPVFYDRHRLLLGVTEHADMVAGKSTLSDGNFDLLNGISWSKGCYIGQELTARMHHRALVKKRLFPVQIEGAAPAMGAILMHENAEIGEMRSAAGSFGLALLNIEKTLEIIAQNGMIAADATRLQPHQPSWMTL